MLDLKNLPRNVEDKIKALLESELLEIMADLAVAEIKVSELTAQRAEIERVLYNGNTPTKIDPNSTGAEVIRYCLFKHGIVMNRADVKKYLSTMFKDESVIHQLYNRASVQFTTEKNRENSFLDIAVINGTEYFGYSDWFDDGKLIQRYFPYALSHG